MSEAYHFWLATTGSDCGRISGERYPALEIRLEDSFEAMRETWWRIGRSLSKEPTAEIAHMPSCGSFGSDFGVMLAWTHLIESLALEADNYLVVCDDPWLFRQLAQVRDINGTRPPPIWMKRFKLWVRGYLARIKVSVLVGHASVSLRLPGCHSTPCKQYLLVYGHPGSNAKGHDAYFGHLMKKIPGLRRMLHTDCPAVRAKELSTDDRTDSLHAWGSLRAAIRLVWAKWRPGPANLKDKFGWIIKRAVAKENGGGGPAMNRWQSFCQENWIKNSGVSVVAWPWENHSWERNFCRAARHRNVRTIGYQHTVIGRHQINYAIYSNHDDEQSLPDWVFSNGPAYRREMIEWGIPENKIRIGGAFRFKNNHIDRFWSDGPVFVPLSAIPEIANRQVEAARLLARAGKRTLVKEHPMYPLAFSVENNLERTDISLSDQVGISAVLYSTGTSGVEAALSGVPAHRFVPADLIAIDVLPEGVDAPRITATDILQLSHSPTAGKALPWDKIFSEVDEKLWQRAFSDDIDRL